MIDRLKTLSSYSYVLMGIIGAVQFFYAMFDGLHYLRRQLPVQFVDVEGVGLGLFFMLLSATQAQAGCWPYAQI